MSKVLSFVKTPGDDCNRLSSIFKDQPNLAWELIQQQSDLYTSANIDVQDINQLTSLYCVNIVVKLNSLQDPREKYFSNKMQKLMAQPFVIRCYTQCSQKKHTNTDLKQKRKQLEQKLSLQTEKQNTLAFQHIIQSQTEKQKKIKSKISDIIGQHEKSLENRLQMRLMKKNIISPIKKSSQDSIIHSTGQLGNPEFMTPNKTLSFQELSLLDLKSMKNRSQEHYASRPQSERIFNYRLEETNTDSSEDSEDEYRIQKMYRQQKMQMAKKKQSDLFNENPRQHRE